MLVSPPSPGRRIFAVARRTQKSSRVREQGNGKRYFGGSENIRMKSGKTLKNRRNRVGVVRGPGRSRCGRRYGDCDEAEKRKRDG